MPRALWCHGVQRHIFRCVDRVRDVEGGSLGLSDRAGSRCINCSSYGMFDDCVDSPYRSRRRSPHCLFHESHLRSLPPELKHLAIDPLANNDSAPPTRPMEPTRRPFGAEAQDRPGRGRRGQSGCGLWLLARRGARRCSSRARRRRCGRAARQRRPG